MSGICTERNMIFISYRRDDSRGASSRVWDRLRIGFGRDRVFRDVDSIGAGKWRPTLKTSGGQEPYGSPAIDDPVRCILMLDVIDCDHQTTGFFQVLHQCI